MKRVTIYLVLVVCAVLLASVSALMQGSLRPQFADRDELSQKIGPSDLFPVNYLNQNRLHKLFIKDQDSAVYQQLVRVNAIREEINYGTFKLVVVDEEALGGRAALGAMQISPRDEQNLIAFNDYLIDTSNPQPLPLQLPTELRQTRMADAKTRGAAPEGGLYVVQFVGPIQDAWLNTLKSTGAEVITYVPNNAYVVRADRRAAFGIWQLKERNSFVQWVGDYEPAFRLTSSLRAARAAGNQPFVKVTVQVLAGAEGELMVDNLKRYSQQFFGERRVMGYHNVTVTIPVSLLITLANDDSVFGIEEVPTRVRLDEAQGQILAGNLSGAAPTGPGYLAWLASKGFNSSQFTTFAVNVQDDATSLTGHPDLPNGRVAFQANPSSQSGAQGGHGFLNAHIIGGFNSGTGAGIEDSLGFNYGLGIAPFARVGATAIFGPTDFSLTTAESAAYNQSARISSNSWGLVDVLQRPIARYDATAQEYDQIVRDTQSGIAGLQQMIVVFAAGNDGSTANTVGSPGTAKNVITVGASENVRQTGTDGCGITNTGADSANDIISFSSRGPVNSAGGDGRVKPDIVAPGTHIQAGIPQSNYDGSSVCNQYFPSAQTLYGWSSGTSHSTPAVAGGAALVYQDFLNKSLSAPSPAMVKAVLMNSASYMTGTGASGNLPSNSQGMGRMNLGRAFDGSQRILVDQTQVLGTTGQTYVTNGSVASTAQPFRVTLAWTDAPGATTGAPWVNNLDLEVTVGGQTYLGNVFSGANSTTGGTADPRNNVESVFIPAGVSGNFTVTVKGTNIAGDGVPGNVDMTDQDFALIIYNATANAPTAPTIGVSPSSLSFSATVGGNNPANQTISLTNVGAGTLNWTASDNAAWLTVTPASGTAPSTLTASVNITSLAVGTYNGSITISATGASNTPLSVPVTLTVAAAGNPELIVNGGFEGSSAPWVLSGRALRATTAGQAHSGTAFLVLGGTNNATGTAYQTISIPAATSPSLNFWLNVTSNETTTTTQFDRMMVEVRSTSGVLLATLATYSNLNKVTGNTYTLRGAFSLATFAGQTVRLQFRTTSDFSLPTSFRVDDISVK